MILRLRSIDFPTGRGHRMETHPKIQLMDALVQEWTSLYILADKSSERVINAALTIPSRSDILDLIVTQVKPDERGVYLKKVGGAWVINKDYTEAKLRAHVGARLLKHEQPREETTSAPIVATDGPRKSDVIIDDDGWVRWRGKGSGNNRLREFIDERVNAIESSVLVSFADRAQYVKQWVNDFRKENPKVRFFYRDGDELTSEEVPSVISEVTLSLIFFRRHRKPIQKLRATATPRKDDELCGLGGAVAGPNHSTTTTTTTIENDWDARQATREKLFQSLASDNVQQDIFKKHFAGSAEEDMIVSAYVKKRLKKNQRFLIQKEDNTGQWYEMTEELAMDWVKHRLRFSLLDDVMNEIIDELRRPPLSIETSSSIMTFDLGSSLGSMSGSWPQTMMSVCT